MLHVNVEFELIIQKLLINGGVNYFGNLTYELPISKSFDSTNNTPATTYKQAHK